MAAVNGRIMVTSEERSTGFGRPFHHDFLSISSVVQPVDIEKRLLQPSSCDEDTIVNKHSHIDLTHPVPDTSQSFFSLIVKYSSIMQRPPSTRTLLQLLFCVTLASGTVAMGIVPVSAGSDAPDEVIVSSNDSIQAAVNGVADNGTVVVKSGTYTQNVTINKSVRIIAPDGAVLTGDNRSGPAFRVQNESTTLVNVTIAGFTIEDYRGPAIAVHTPGNTINGLNVSANTASDVESGVSITATNAGQVTDVDVQQNAFTDLDRGVYISAGDQATVTNVRLDTNDVQRNSRDAVEVAAYGDATIADVYGTQLMGDGSSNGVSIEGYANASIGNVTFEDNGFNETDTIGIRVFATGNATLTDIEFDSTATLNSTSYASQAQLFEEATLTDLTLSRMLGTGSADGVSVITENTSSLQGLNIAESAFNETVDDYSVGVEVFAKNKSTIDTVTIERTNLSDGDVGVTAGASGTATLQDLHLAEVKADRTTDSGFSIQSGIWNNATATVDNISAQSISANGSQIGILATTNGTSDLTNVSVERGLLRDNELGVLVTADNESTVGPIDVRNTLIENSSANAVHVDVAQNASHNGIDLQQTLLAESTVGLYVSKSTHAAGIDVHRSFISGNDAGVQNYGSGLVDARYNYWGDSTGPSSPADGALADPVVDAVADGAGDSVSAGSDGEANVRFAPAIGGKDTTGPEEIDPVPDQRVNVSLTEVIAVGDRAESFLDDRRIEGPLTDFVGTDVWERSILPLRADSSVAETSVMAPGVFLRTDEGDVSLNRDHISVYGTGTSIPLSFDKVMGADTTQWSNDNAQLIVLRTDGDSANVSGMINHNIDERTGDVSVTVDDADVVEVRELQLEGDGEVDTSFTPARPSDYVAVLATSDYDNGFVQNGTGLDYNVHNSSSTLVGAEYIAVQSAQSAVEPDRQTVEPGDELTVTAQSNLDANQVNHLVLAYNQPAFVDKTVIINETAISTAVQSGAIVTINGTVDGDPFFINATITNGTVENHTVGGAIAGVNESIAVVEDGDATETVTLPIAENLSVAADETVPFRLVHVATTATNASKRSTDAAMIDVVGATEPEPAVTVSPTSINFDQVAVGETKTDAVEVRNEGTAPLDIRDIYVWGHEKEDSSQFHITESTVGGQLAPGESGTVTVQFAPTSEGTVSDWLKVETNDTDNSPAAVELTGEGSTSDSDTGNNDGTGDGTDDGTNTGGDAPSSGGGDDDGTDSGSDTGGIGSGGSGGVGGGVGGNDGTQVRVTTIPSGARAEIPVIDPGLSRTAHFGDRAVEDGIGLVGFTVHSATGTGAFEVDVTWPSATSTGGAPALGARGTAIRYLSITPSGIDTANVSAVDYRFRVRSSVLPAGTSRERVTLFRYDGGRWTALETEALSNETYEAHSPGFSPYAIGIQTQEQANLTIREADVANSELGVGESTTVTATIENTGRQEGTRTVNLTVDGAVVQTDTVTVAAGASETVTFDVTFDEAGTYELGVSGTNAGTVDVTADVTTPATQTPTETMTETTETTPGDDETGGSALLIVALVLLGLLVIGGGYLYWAGYVDEYLQANQSQFK